MPYCLCRTSCPLTKVQKYHSLAVKGEKVKVDLPHPENSLVNGDSPTAQDSEKANEPLSTGISAETSAKAPAAMGIPQVLMNTGKTLLIDTLGRS